MASLPVSPLRQQMIQDMTISAAKFRSLKNLDNVVFADTPSTMAWSVSTQRDVHSQGRHSHRAWPRFKVLSLG
jgi:hypothetical protein